MKAAGLFQISGNRRRLAVLVDPDKTPLEKLPKLLEKLVAIKVDYIFIGSSLMSGSVDEAARLIRKNCQVPLVLFPGHPAQLTNEVDAILFLSLISGRNPDLLIGQHVHVAMKLKKLAVEVVPTGYMLIDGGSQTSASYMSNSMPIPANKPDIAVSTAVAGELLGLEMIYLDAGSGALTPVPSTIIEAVKRETNIPIIVGGGIRSAEAVEEAWTAGADVVVIGTAVEENAGFIDELAVERHAVGG